MDRAVFLDRDGTLNLDTGYVHKREDWQWLPGVLDALARLSAAGWKLVVVSNQSGIGRGYFSRHDLDQLEAWLNNELAKNGIAMAGWYYCPHAPEDNCACRKPKPGMLLEAAKNLRLDLPRSWMIGDRLRDVAAGIGADCRAGLILNNKYPDEAAACREKFPQARIWRSLVEGADYILS